MLATAYGEANRQHRGLMPRREHTDRRTISKYRSAFDRRSEVASQPCHHSCSGCGALRAPTAGHPHRNSAQSEP
nr:hypothetical protein [Deltaproteobacteria bacterium]